MLEEREESKEKGKNEVAAVGFREGGRVIMLFGNMENREAKAFWSKVYWVLDLWNILCLLDAS